MATFNTWLPDNIYSSYNDGVTKSLTMITTKEGGDILAAAFAIPNAQAGFLVVKEHVTPYFNITKPPKIFYSCTVECVLGLKDAAGWIWEAPMPAQPLGMERGWAWNQFVLAGVQGAEMAGIPSPTTPTVGVIQAFQFRAGEGGHGDSNTTVVTINIAYLTSNTPVKIEAGTMKKFSLADKNGAAHTLKVGDVLVTTSIDLTPDPGDPDPPVEELWPAVPFPGRRLAMVGDSITWYNTAYVPPVAWNGKFEGFGFGMGGYWTTADQIMQGRMVFEHGISSDPSGRHHGYNFAIAGTKVVNWWKPVDVPITGGGNEVGPMYSALNNLSKFDVVLMMGGTNDLSGNATAATVLTLLKKAVSDLASAGKWVFLLTIPPRSRDALQGYTLAQQDVIRTRLTQVNQGLRDWISDVKPPNVWLSDAYSDCLGPNGIDPAGFVSSSVDATAPSTRGNYRTDAPGIVFMHDGLHPGPGGGYVIGKKLAETMLSAGIPARVSPTTLGPLTLGPNILPNPEMTFTQFGMSQTPPTWNYSRIGWATGLGVHQKTADNKANGYPNGKIPDFWHFYKANNSEDSVIGYGTGGTYSNFNNYTWADMADEFPAIKQYMNDSTWPVGAVQVSIITDEGVPAVKIDYNIPVTGNKNEAFVLNAMFPQDQHGPWDNWGWMGSDNGQPRPNTAFSAGDVLISEADVKLVGISPNLVSCQSVVYMYAIVPQAEFGASRLTFGNHPFFWPPSDMDKIRFHTANRTMHMRSPAVAVPAYKPTETIRYGELRFEFCVDASVTAATGTIIIKNVAVRKVLSGSLM